MNYNHVSATIGIKAVDPRILADDKFLKRMSNFDRVCKQIDAKHDRVMEMLANIQEQLRNLEMKQRKERDAQIQSQMAAIKPPYLSVSRPQQIEVESRILPPNQRLSSSSYASNDAKLENEGCVEVLKPSPIISAVVVETVETDFFTTRATKIHARKVFDEIPESKKSKISAIPPLVRGSDIAESTQEIKMESDGLSLILNPSSFSSNSDGTKQEDEGSLKVSIYTTVAELQPQELESGFEVFPKPTLVTSKSIDSIGKVETLSWPLIVPKVVEEISVLENPKMMDNHSVHYILCRDVHSRDLVQWPENFPNLNVCELTPSWRIMASSLLQFPFLYNCYNGDGLTKEELKWLDTGQYLIVNGLSRERVTSNFIVSWNSSNEMYQNKNILVSGMELNGFELDLSTIGVVLGINPRRIANLQMSEMVVNDLCSSLVNSHDHGIVGWFLKDSRRDVSVLEVNELIRATQEKQLKAGPRRTMVESFKSGVNEVLYKLRADVGSSAQRILAGGNNLIAMFTGGYKGSFNNISQIDKSNDSICSFVSQNNILKCSRMNREKVLCIVTSKSNTLGLVGCNICWFQTICLVLCFKNLSSVTPHARTRRICFYTFMELAVGKWLKDGNRTCLQIDSLPIARLCEICDGLFEMFPTWNKNLGSDNLERIIDDCRVAKYFLELQFEMVNSRAVFHLICLINLELKKLVPLKTLMWLDWLLSAFRSQIYPEVYRIFHSPDLASLITLDFESLKGGSSSLTSFSNVFIGCSGSFGETIISTSIEAKGQGVALEFIIPFGSRELNVGVGMMTESLIKQRGDHSTMSRVNKVDKILDRPSAKPPFQFRHLSLGDKTLSRGEYCHGNG